MVRPATLEDAPGIADVHVATWRTTYRGLLPDDFLASLSEEHYTERWRRVIGEGSSRVFVVDAPEGVAGFASGGRERAGENGPEDWRSHAGLESLHVHAAWKIIEFVFRKTLDAESVGGLLGKNEEQVCQLVLFDETFPGVEQIFFPVPQRLGWRSRRAWPRRNPDGQSRRCCRPARACRRPVSRARCAPMG